MLFGASNSIYSSEVSAQGASSLPLSSFFSEHVAPNLVWGINHNVNISSLPAIEEFKKRFHELNENDNDLHALKIKSSYARYSNEITIFQAALGDPDENTTTNISVLDFLFKYCGVGITKSYKGDSYLHIALQYGVDIDAITLLVDNCSDLNVKGIGGNTPLFEASKSNRKAAVELLLNRGADINAENDFGKNPLVQACESNNPEIAKLLLDRGANIHTDFARQAFINACKYNHTQIVELLLNYGADANEKDLMGFAPLHWFSHKGNEEMVEFLIRKGADVMSKNTVGAIPLHYARSEKVIRLLFNAGVDINSKDSLKQTSLHYICKQYALEKETIVLLLELGADINSKDSYGNTPLSCVVNCQYRRDLRYRFNYEYENENKAIIKLLLERGADVNSKDSHGNSVLHYAAQYENENLVQLLLDYRADASSINIYGDTPSMFAKHHNNEKIEQLLLDAQSTSVSTDATSGDEIGSQSQSIDSENTDAIILDNSTSYLAVSFVAITAISAFLYYCLSNNK